ncbi:diacylglycerol kinase family lipid kinase [Allorhizobium sp. BGMRC 0089]|uniref:diacylglycerol/lipid kinase family protein n=1 Tax=Allorhizobium sonneratiae TaxID=2934936 RepID=UPI0020343387|nr:diacylglycerol kinase family protein [Allorhizobium sonneratiae]MCM2291948.1 diacylglycerol kinase family lipid kinase [Allorhizobium sonneratiae]
MKVKAVFNRDGGTFRTTDMAGFCRHVEAAFRSAGHDLTIETVSGKEIVKALKSAALEGYDGLLAGGGDGTISAAAGIAWRHGLALGVVPAGTMNLFARTLGLPLDIWRAVDVLAQAQVRSVDIATANGRPFVHQFSAGMHARMVRLRNRMSFASRFGKMRASLHAAASVMVNPPQFTVSADLDGARVTHDRKVSALSVTNNPLGSNPLLIADGLTAGKLGIYLASALTTAGVLRLTFDILRGRLKDNQAVTAATASAVRLHFPAHRKGAACVIDGELLRMPRDVDITIHAGALKVLVPVKA